MARVKLRKRHTAIDLIWAETWCKLEATITFSCILLPILPGHVPRPHPDLCHLQCSKGLFFLLDQTIKGTLEAQRSVPFSAGLYT